MSADDPRLQQIPTGCTCPGVNAAIIRYLLESGRDFDGNRMLDVPCGDGTFATTLQRFFPLAVLRGCDLQPPKALAADQFSLIDASRPFRVFPEAKFDLITCVSGVMEFDNTLQFFTICREHLRDDGMLIVTNDSVTTVRDRLRFLFFGKFRQFGLFVKRGQPTWKVIPIYNLTRLLYDAGFEIREIRYVSVSSSDWVTLPFALILYALQRFYMWSRAEVPVEMQRRMYPFASLLCRHYIVICDPTGEPSTGG